MIVMQRLIQVDGKVRTDMFFPAGFMDVVSIEKTKEQFRILYNTKGKFCIHRISKGDAVWNALWSLLDRLDLAELVCGLILADPVDANLPLGIVQEAECLLGFLNVDDVHEAGWEEHVRSHLTIDLDQALHDNHLRLIVRKRILQ